MIRPNHFPDSVPEPYRPLAKLLQEMGEEGAEAFILGCTETPLAVEMYHLQGDFIDSTGELAKAAVKKALEA